MKIFRLVYEGMLILLVLLLASCLPACGTAPVKTVQVVVKEREPLPDWAKTQPAKPAPADTVYEHLERENALEAIVDGYACRIGLLVQLDLKKAVDPGACK